MPGRGDGRRIAYSERAKQGRLRDYGTMTIVEVLYEDNGGWEVQGDVSGGNG
jgi:hypothetical protein